MRMELGKSTLRPWRMEDAAQLADAANNRNVWLGVRDVMPFPYLLGDAESFLQRKAADGSANAWCIVVDGAVAGGIHLRQRDDVSRITAEIGYWLGERWWGRGIMTEAADAVVAYGFANLPIERIEAFVFDGNVGSCRVLEKCGFAFEARLRRAVIKDGTILDNLVYAKLRSGN